MHFKKYLYIFLCIVLGLLLATIFHTLLEIGVLSIITGDMERYGDSFMFTNWELVHLIGSGVLWLGGLLGGVWAGFAFWHILYVEERYGKPRF